ncbi:MAG: L-fucose/L-arabinose isomerase family protein [Bacteroidota bacterium]
MKPRIALLTLADHRDEFYAQRAPLAEAETAKVRGLGEAVEFVLDELVRSGETARAAGYRARNAGADILLLHTPIWAPPNLGLIAARIAGLPVALLANTALATSGLPGLLSCAATLDQAGIAHRRFFGDVAAPAFRNALLSFFKAGAVRRALVGSRMCLLGGFGVGLYSASLDPAQWQKLFGIEISHVDQLEIVRRAEALTPAEVEPHVRWLLGHIGRAELDAPSLSPAHLERQIRSYLATRALLQEGGYDFAALKCQPELSNGYALQCLNVALLNDPYDADGAKRPCPCSCEADADGALTMKILSLLSAKPAALLDVRGFLPEEGLLVLANCGGMPTYFAGRSERPEVNLAEVHILPHVFGRAGGGTTQFVAAPGSLTLARLCRRDGKYWLAVVHGEAVAKPREFLRQSTYPWPHAFLRGGVSPDGFVEGFGSNHLHAAAGDWRRELKDLCGLYEIEYRDFTGGE